MKLLPLHASEYVCELLYKNSIHAIFAHIVCAIALLYLYRDIIPQSSFIFWVVIFSLMVFIKGSISWLFYRRSSEASNTDFWYQLFLFGSLVTAFVWAAVILVLFPEQHPAYQPLLIVITIGLAGGAALTQSSDKIAVLVLSQPILLAAVIRLYFIDDMVYNATASLLLFLDIPVVIAALNSSEASIRLHQSAMIERRMNSAKIDFLANMSHEIRTPMNAVVGIGHLLEKTDLSSKQQNYVSKLQRASDSLLGIINRILDFSRIEAGQMELEKTPFDLSGVMETVTAHVETQAKKKGLSFHFDVSENVENRLIGDPLRLAQILTNLCANGVKFTDEGGVHVRVRQTTTVDGVNIAFSVVDTGLGIEEHDKEKLFESFTQLNTSDTRKYGGTGLGLAISQRLLGMMGSKIEVGSVIGKGTTFSFSVNFDIAPEGSVEEVNRTKNTTPTSVLACLPELQDREVLLVDDDELNQEIAKEMLHIFGVNVRIASSAKEAFWLLNEDLPDLIFMDLQMPEMSGYEALDVLHANHAWLDIPVIALTANARVVEKRKALAYGMDDFLTKPIDPQQLKKVLLDWIPHENISAEVAERGDFSKVGKEKIDSEAEVKAKLKAVIDMLGVKSSTKFFKKVDKVIAKEKSQLKKLLHDHYWDKAAILAHRLKGSLNLYGSTTLANVLTQIDDKEIASDDTDNICRILQTEFDLIQKILKRHI